MSKEAMNLALEALESIEWHGTRGRCWVLDNEKVESAITALREDLAKPDFWEGYVPEPTQKRPPNCGTGHCSCIECVMKPAQQALDKKAENARELGLDYEPAQQEPVATVTSETGADISMSWWHEPALPIGTKLYTSPPAQRTWVGLTDEEAFQICVDCGCLSEDWLTLLDAIEAKLRSKNA